MQAAVKEIYVDQAVAEYIVRLVDATREHPDVYLGASPRGSHQPVPRRAGVAALDGRDYVIPDDVKGARPSPILAHRLIVKSQASLREVDPDAIVREVLAQVPIGEPPASDRLARRAAHVDRWAPSDASSASSSWAPRWSSPPSAPGSISSSSSSICSRRSSSARGSYARQGLRGVSAPATTCSIRAPRSARSLQAVYRVDNQTRLDEAVGRARGTSRPAGQPLPAA